MTKFIQIFLFIALLLSSCISALEQEKECEFEAELCSIVPFCAWPPVPDNTIALPLAFHYNDEIVSHEDYSFKWSSDPDFGAAAISVRYDDLPVTVVVTELATECEVEVTLSAN